jgi:curved DNA-binding protein CbpA
VQTTETAAAFADHYETLQLSRNADEDTIQRVFRLLAQRFHPDNQQTGSEERFRLIHEAYVVLSDPEKRASYDARHESIRRERWRFAAQGAPQDNDFAMEQHYRYIVLEILYSRRRSDPDHPGLSQLDLAQLVGRPREHLEFTLWYLVQKKFLMRGDQSSVFITADGVDWVEANTTDSLKRRRLTDHH